MSGVVLPENLFLFPRELGWCEDRWQLKGEILSCLYTRHKLFHQGSGDSGLSPSCQTDADVLHSWHGALPCLGFCLLAANPAPPAPHNGMVTRQTFLGVQPAAVHVMLRERHRFCLGKRRMLICGLLKIARGFHCDCSVCGWDLTNCFSAGAWIPADQVLWWGRRHAGGRLEYWAAGEGTPQRKGHVLWRASYGKEALLLAILVSPPPQHWACGFLYRKTHTAVLQA